MNIILHQVIQNLINRFILEKYVPVRYQQDFNICKREDVDFIAISPIQVISAATALIPFH